MSPRTTLVLIAFPLCPVARGANLLDEKHPGWAKKINLSTLDMSGARHCILGQLYGSSEDGCKALGVDDYRSFRPQHGFEASSIGGYVENCERLRLDWCMYIIGRLQDAHIAQHGGI